MWLGAACAFSVDAGLRALLASADGPNCMLQGAAQTSQPHATAPAWARQYRTLGSPIVMRSVLGVRGVA